MRKIVLLDFVHHLNCKIIKYNVSKAGFYFRLKVKEGGRLNCIQEVRSSIRSMIIGHANLVLLFIFSVSRVAQ
jgi:hypothetical protein